MANNQIALLAQAPVLDTPVESQGKALQLRQLMNQGAVQDMDMAQRRQAIADDAGARNVFATESDPAARIQALYKINPKAAQAVEKAQADLGKTGAETSHLSAQTQELQGKAIAQAFILHRDQINTVNDPQSAAAWVKSAFSDPITGPIVSRVGNLEIALSKIPSDPTAFQQWKLQAGLSANEYVKHTSVDANTASNNRTSIATNAATNATQRRGQDLSNARSLEANQNSRGVIIQTDTGPMLANTRTGGTQQIIGPDGKPVTRTKPLTEFQGKSAAFGDRAMAADKILGELGTNYSPAAVNAKNAVEGTPLVGGAMGAITNKFALSENDQRAEQAQRDFINAVLRQESGAAIGANEFDNARKQYFPQPGDKPKNIAQKAANRKLVIEGFKRSAGANADFTPAGDSSQPNSLPTGWSVEVH